MTDETLLHRQVHPSWCQDGEITSQVFRPTPKDRNKLSVYDGDKITAEESWRHYSRELGYLSIGVMSVSVKECTALSLTPNPDPTTHPAHALIDFGQDGKSQASKKAEKLKQHAKARGWQYLQDKPSTE
ncbi:MAG: hypothetical protein ACP5I8_01200 [Phycisphaerae bacterium]